MTVIVPTRAQQNPCLNRSIVVNVVTPEGRLVAGLSAANFRGKLRGQKVEITSAARDQAPRRIAVVLDASGSMRDKWTLAVFVARDLLRVDPASSFALIKFSARVDDKIDFAQGRQKISEKLAAFGKPSADRVRGLTALRDALSAALDLLCPAQFGDAICLISDGDDNASTSAESHPQKELVSAGVRLFAFVPIDVAQTRLRTSADMVGPHWVEKVVIATGGDLAEFVMGPGYSDGSISEDKVAVTLSQAGQPIIALATRGLAGEINSVYRLDLALPEALNKPRGWSLEVVNGEGKTEKRWRLIYPKQLAACP